MRLKVFPITVAAVSGVVMPATAPAEEPTPAVRAWMKAVSHRLQSEGFRVQSTRIEAQGLTFEATFRAQGNRKPAALPVGKLSSAGNR